MSDSPIPLGLAHTPLRSQTRDEIRQRIIDGRLTPGTRIVERELAAELQVSRVPVREALRMLESEGFLEVVPRRGVVVKRMTRRDVEELFDVRQSLEVLATRRATERVTAEDLARLRSILDGVDRAIAADDTEEIGRGNERFHDAIIAMADNNLLAAMLEPLQGRLHWLFRQNQNATELQREHRTLYDAIASGDPERAAAQALAHVLENRDVARELLFDSRDEADSAG
ncbi:GntR family transcriptional regulator [Nocardioides sp. NPDC126508]